MTPVLSHLHNQGTNADGLWKWTSGYISLGLVVIHVMDQRKKKVVFIIESSFAENKDLKYSTFNYCPFTCQLLERDIQEIKVINAHVH